MDDVIRDFLADLQLQGRMQRTIEGHGQELRRLQCWLEEQGLIWSSIHRRDLQVYARLRADKSYSSRSNMLCSLRVFYRWAVEQGYIALSPAAGFKTPAKPHPLPRALTLEQIRRLLECLRAAEGRRARRDEALLLTALYAGLRACQLASLRWPAVDLAGGVINIRISKMNKGRAVKIHPALAQVLTAWRSTQGMDADGPVFSLDGMPINPNRVGKIARRYAVALSIPLTAHSLRHTFATWSLRRSGDLYSVSKALGHSQLRQTEIYIASDVADSHPAVDSLPDLDSW
jgi:site-specific recombinase XerC